jgi:hypothetical protein
LFLFSGFLYIASKAPETISHSQIATPSPANQIAQPIQIATIGSNKTQERSFIENISP